MSDTITIIHNNNDNLFIRVGVTIAYGIVGYEPADFTLHPPPRTAEGGFIFCRIGVQCSPKNVLKGKPEYFGVIHVNPIPERLGSI